MSQRLVINELRMYRKRYKIAGCDVKIVGESFTGWDTWRKLATAWNPKTKQFNYLVQGDKGRNVISG